MNTRGRGISLPYADELPKREKLKSSRTHPVDSNTPNPLAKSNGKVVDILECLTLQKVCIVAV
jgi:hypothetical protein